jgi:hypothetical protein
MGPKSSEFFSSYHWFYSLNTINSFKGYKDSADLGNYSVYIVLLRMIDCNFMINQIQVTCMKTIEIIL